VSHATHSKPTKGFLQVFDLIKNVVKSKQYLEEGWYGLRNRLPSELDISDKERDSRESRFFDGEDWKALDRNKLGRHHLKSALIKMRNRHVKKNIQGLLSKIQARLETCIENLNECGEPRTTNAAQFTLVNKIATEYHKMAEGALEGHYDVLQGDEKLYARKRIRDDLDKFQREMVQKGPKTKFRLSDQDADIVAKTPEHQWAEKLLAEEGYAWIRSAITTYRGTEGVGEINPEVKKPLWKEQTESWKATASATLERVEKSIEQINAGLFEKACPDNELRVKIMQLLGNEFEKAAQDAKREMQRIILDEQDAHLFTLHPSKMDRQQAYHKDRVKAITAKYVAANPLAGLPQATAPPSKINHLSADVIINSLIYQNAELVGVLNTHDSLAAYYDVALYRFIDNFALQVVERHLLGPHGPLRLFNTKYVAANLYGPSNEKKLSDLASENPSKAKRRAELEVEKKSLEESKKLVQSFKVL
jgi:Dynamin central region